MNATTKGWQDQEASELTVKVHTAQIQQLYKQTSVGLVGIAVIILLICLDLWQVLPRWKLSSWGVAALFVVIARSALTVSFHQKNPKGPDIYRWAQLHVVGAGSSAVLWGAAALFLWPENAPAHQLLWPICIVAVSASAVAMYHTWPPSYLSYLLLAVTPLALRFLLGGETAWVVLGLLGLFFVAILAQTGRLMNAATKQALVMAMRNEALSQHMAEEKGREAVLSDTVPSPIFVKDAAGRYTGCNKAFEAFVARRREELIGRTVQELWPATLAERYHDMDLELMKKGGTQTYESQVKRGDGGLRDVIFNKAVFSGSNGAPQGLVGVILDITDRKRAEEEARRAAEENSRLEAQMRHSRMVTSLMTQLSHDLNTPLTPLLALLPMIRDGVGAPQLERMLDICQVSATTIQKLASKSLDLLRLSSGTERPPLVAVELAAAADHAVEETAEELLERGVSCANRIDRDVRVWGASDQLALLFKHLLSNAARYAAEKGAVRIGATVRDACVEVSVADDGIGLPPEQGSLIFQEFYKADPARRDVSTHGLGLAICQRIVLNHGGRIWAESPGVGQGTTIRFTLGSSDAPLPRGIT